ncbi:uncharacterized protein EV420DRAFT_1481741 [Desarmillaria tabescens]|uniref:Uncharacterized protein n=1 Tax=Armillaria tabescens TaxID=1929756 RepID=A0AA39K5V9_ARMTA|nr:uncharacterized protein EV420DRAFT_1481741 [Desarmillaria tabescens]KAK0454020.1 hypothetical protein EV420DRAFT_1481741 [Desarmillaria tabescens]
MRKKRGVGTSRILLVLLIPPTFHPWYSQLERFAIKLAILQRHRRFQRDEDAVWCTRLSQANSSQLLQIKGSGHAKNQRFFSTPDVQITMTRFRRGHIQFCDTDGGGGVCGGRSWPSNQYEVAIDYVLAYELVVLHNCAAVKFCAEVTDPRTAIIPAVRYAIHNLSHYRDFISTQMFYIAPIPPLIISSAYLTPRSFTDLINPTFASIDTGAFVNLRDYSRLTSLTRPVINDIPTLESPSLPSQASSTISPLFTYAPAGSSAYPGMRIDVVFSTGFTLEWVQEEDDDVFHDAARMFGAGDGEEDAGCEGEGGSGGSDAVDGGVQHMFKLTPILT